MSEIIRRELEKMYTLIGEKPTDFVEIYQIWCTDLRHIPEEYISECFEIARKHNRRFKLIRSSQVLEAWIGVCGREGHKFHQKDLPGKYYTIKSLPWIYWSNRNRDLLRKFKEKKLIDGEAYEFEQLNGKKFFVQDLKINEDLQKEIDQYSKGLPTEEQAKTASKLLIAAMNNKIKLPEAKLYMKQIMEKGKITRVTTKGVQNL